MVVVVLVVALGAVFTQTASNKPSITAVQDTVTTTVQNTITTTVFSTQTVSQLSSSSGSQSSMMVTLSSIGFTVGDSTATVYQRLAQPISVPTNSTITVTIVLNNTGTPPNVRAVNGTSISQLTPQNWNFHIISGGQVFNQSPPAQAWYPQAFIPSDAKGIIPPNSPGALPNGGNTTLYLEILVPDSVYNDQLVISVF
ncbi:MAG: hypothetical protein ACYC7D_03290 [Nitrososphaerales archaeon]